MALLRVLHTSGWRALRVVAGLLLLAYGAMSQTLLGIIALMAGVTGIVTGFARLPRAPAPGNFSRNPGKPAAARRDR